MNLRFIKLRVNDGYFDRYHQEIRSNLKTVNELLAPKYCTAYYDFHPEQSPSLLFE